MVKSLSTGWMVRGSKSSTDNKFTFLDTHFDLHFAHTASCTVRRYKACFVGLMLRGYCANYPLHLTQRIRMNAALSSFWLLTRRNLALNTHDRITAIFPLRLLYVSFPMAMWPSSGHSLLILELLDHTKPPTTVDRSPLDEWSARRRDLYLTIHDTHDRQTSMSPGRTRSHNPSKQAAADSRLRSRGHGGRRVL